MDAAPYDCTRHTLRLSIIALKYDLLLVEAQFLQAVANVVHHLLQTTDVDVEIASPAQLLKHLLLHPAGIALPVWSWPRDRADELEVGMFACEFFKLRLIEDAVVIADPKHEDIFVLAVPRQDVL